MKRIEFPGYTIVRENPGGGMTDSFVALDQEKQRVLLRTPNASYLKDKTYLKGFARGAQVLSQLDHPNIARLLAMGETRGQPFMVLEYIEGRNVRELILKKDPFLLQQGLRLVRQLASVVHYVHHQGFLHLDLKPDNLIVHGSGQLFLIDFDLARPSQARGTKLKQVPGTTAYLPPEALLKKRVNEQTDIYSFGVTAYEMLTLHKPYEATTAEALKRMQLDLAVEPVPMSKHNADVASSVAAVISKCLAKIPDSRYPSMSLVLKDMETNT